MNKLEKYINYVVGDLVKNTEIDYDKERIYFPSPLLIHFSHISLYSPLFILPPSPFSKYIRERYGAKDEEIKIIWGLYKERIKSLFKK